MQATVTIDAELLRIAEALAAERRVPVGTVISELIRKGLESAAGVSLDVVDGLPLFRVQGGSRITNEDVRRLDDES